MATETQNTSSTIAESDFKVSQFTSPPGQGAPKKTVGGASGNTPEPEYTIEVAQFVSPPGQEQPKSTAGGGSRNSKKDDNVLASLDNIKNILENNSFNIDSIQFTPSDTIASPAPGIRNQGSNERTV